MHNGILCPPKITACQFYGRQNANLFKSSQASFTTCTDVKELNRQSHKISATLLGFCRKLSFQNYFHFLIAPTAHLHNWEEITAQSLIMFQTYPWPRHNFRSHQVSLKCCSSSLKIEIYDVLSPTLLNLFI